tara:strand:- start:910 stop:1962 length:1053 start_codon:yes stop_codon:yes gene_type:complete
MSRFATLLIHWQKNHGRHHLPWQKTRDPYAIWLSEIMLQQTQVNTVIPYYLKFMQSFPTIISLAQASLENVLVLWSGLGYYSRARHLHQAACIINRDYHNKFPQDKTLIQQLPGIGRSTAAAITVFAYGQHFAILDGNVKRVLTRHFGIDGFPGERKIQNQLWRKAEELLPDEHALGHIEAYTQAIMDLGATVCTRHQPSCTICPLQHQCVAFKENRQNELPTSKPHKPLPKKEAIFLILIKQKKLLLKKRQNTGIWGGLWCLPEIQTDENISAYCTQHLKLKTKCPVELPPLDHSFTHFKLRIYPHLLQVISHAETQQDLETWVDPDEALNKAIPTPVRKLLKQHLFTK